MKIKSYFAPTVEDAMAMARQELGPKAMLANSRGAPPEARGRGEYEVVFAGLEEGLRAPAEAADGKAAFLWHGAARTRGPGDSQPRPGIGAGADRASVARAFGGLDGHGLQGGLCTLTWRLNR